MLMNMIEWSMLDAQVAPSTTECERHGLPRGLVMTRPEALSEAAAKVYEVYGGSIRQRMEDRHGLLIYGGRSQGKSSLASLIFKRAMSWHVVCYWITARDLRNSGRDRDLWWSRDREIRPLDRAQMVNLLVLDDVDEADFADRYYGEAFLLGLLRDRVDAGGVNVVTTASREIATKIADRVPNMPMLNLGDNDLTAERNSRMTADLMREVREMAEGR